MHGDDTWLKLFPGLFTRHDGVSSFFVSIIFYQDMNISLFSVNYFDFLVSVTFSFFLLNGYTRVITHTHTHT